MLRLALVCLALAACRPPPGSGSPVDETPDLSVADLATAAFAAQCTPQVVFSNLSTNGSGAIFDASVPDPDAFIQAQVAKLCPILYVSPASVPTRPKVTLLVEDITGAAYTLGDEIHLNANYLKSYSDGGGDVGKEITGVLIHELTHVYQYDDGPGYLIEGMADFVRYRAGYVPVANRHAGGSWTDAYQVTAFFLDYLDVTYPGMGPQLNLAMDPNDATPWSDSVFMTLTSKSLSTLWAEYQATL